MKREMAKEAKSPEFANNECDLDFDDMIEDDSQMSRSIDEVVDLESGENNVNDDSPSVGSSLGADLGAKHVKAKKNKHSSGHKNSGLNFIKPRIKGLRIIPRAQFLEESSGTSNSGHGKTNSQSLMEQGSSSTDHKITNNANMNGGMDDVHTDSTNGVTAHNKYSHGQQNFINYYESVIPILPSAQASMPPSVSSSMINSYSKDGENVLGVTEHPVERHRLLGSHENSKSSLSEAKSQLSLQNEYIRQLNRADSTSFPMTGPSTVTATASQMNLINNYPAHRPGGSSVQTSRSNSSYNIAAGISVNNVRSPSSGHIFHMSHSSLGGGKESSQQALLSRQKESESSNSSNEDSFMPQSKTPSSQLGQKSLLTQVTPSREDSSNNDDGDNDDEDGNDDDDEDDNDDDDEDENDDDDDDNDHEDDDDDNDDDDNEDSKHERVGRKWTDTSETYSQTEKAGSEPKVLTSPFDTPPRQSQYMSPINGDEDNYEDGDDTYDIVQSGHDRDLTSPYRIHDEADEEFSNYSANKKAWLDSMKPKC
ncbi:hypothetical protein FOA43_003791 [Brettanomyces nanus]|uniref:Uncharacterized protein n=1 Tax=Eeniella nana TaxID=13502 RepID=A0A875S966_EENNA|nr:uncharacterized protein FOA43_003791 [Brettanomyces nanus]QPG76402.1 hypothetical protein FOA43_003791 [Brettanomyces nanus]